MEQFRKSTVKISRRDFLKKAGIAAVGLGGTILASKLGKKDEASAEAVPAKKTSDISPTEENQPQKEKKTTTEEEIERCRQIIKEKRYEEIILAPYLVSALYYSRPAIEKMRPPRQNNSEKIILGIYPLITKEFREGYIDTLKRILQEKSGRTAENTPGAQSLPLKTISFGRNLKENHLDAIDLFTKEGSPIYSISEGLVVLAEDSWKEHDDRSTSSNRGGNTVIIFDPENNSFYRYAHLREMKVSPGMILPSGKSLGTVGHTGAKASEPWHGEHLHLEINKYDAEKGIMVPTDVFELKKEIETLEHS